MEQVKPLLYPNAVRDKVRVSVKSNINRCIYDIKCKFAENNLEKPSEVRKKNLKKFNRSCFGTLYKKMSNVVLCGGLVHNLLIRQVESMSEQVMEFNFNGKGAIFTIKEFGIITGLRIDNALDAPPPPPISFRLLDTYFEGRRRTKNSELRDKFVELDIDDCEKSYDLVRLGLLYILECALLGKESQSIIDMEHFSMVEDLDYFNQYPWGLESYNLTISSLHKVFKLHIGRLNASNTYSLGGFPTAFQVIS